MKSLDNQIANLSRFYQRNLNLTKEESIRKANMFLKQYNPLKESNEDGDIEKLNKELRLFFACNNEIPKMKTVNKSILTMRCTINTDLINVYGDVLSFIPKSIEIKVDQFKELYKSYTEINSLYQTQIKYQMKNQGFKSFFSKYLDFALFAYVNEKYKSEAFAMNKEKGELLLRSDFLIVIKRTFNLDVIKRKVDNILCMETNEIREKIGMDMSLKVTLFIFLTKYKQFFDFFFKLVQYLKDKSKVINQ